MKQLLTFTLAFLVCSSFIQRVQAQDDERRNKIQMVIVFGGKTITTDLSSVSSSISRYDDEVADTSEMGKDSRSRSFNLGMEVRKMDRELLKVLAKRTNKFDGTITIVDSYGKNPTKTFGFKKAGLSNYADQYSTASYNDSYGNISLSISCAELSVDGISID